MSVELTRFVTLLRTNNVVQVDWVSNALEEAGIPHKRQRLSRLTPMEAWRTIQVPESFLAQARDVLAQLPLETSSGGSQAGPAGTK
jgi:hypothetical protein